MTKHGSALLRKQNSRTLDADLKRRARKLAIDSRVDPRTRSLIRYGLEIKDEHLEQAHSRGLREWRWDDTSKAHHPAKPVFPSCMTD